MTAYEDWPPPSHPSNVKAYFKDEIVIAAQRSTVWSWLSRPGLYPYWYKKWGKVRVSTQKEAQLVLHDVFVPYIQGLKSPTEVIDVKRDDTIAWTGKRFGIRGVHSWRLLDDGTATVVVTEETLKGFLPDTFPKAFINAGHSMHQHWLQQLKKVSEITEYTSQLTAEEIHRLAYGSK